MCRRGEQGFTLIELMVVVAIVAVLAAIAVFMFSKTVGNAHAQEVHDVFGEIALKQEQYLVENGEYFNLSTSENNKCCGADGNSYGSIPAGWGADLKLNLQRRELKCNYAVVAGAAEDNTGIGAIGSTMLDDPPPETWWYGVAYCPSNDKTYVTKYNQSRVIEY